MAVNSYFATLMGSWHGIHKGKIKSNFARNTCLRVREIKPLKLLNRGRELSDCIAPSIAPMQMQMNLCPFLARIAQSIFGRSSEQTECNLVSTPEKEQHQPSLRTKARAHKMRTLH